MEKTNGGNLIQIKNLQKRLRGKVLGTIQIYLIILKQKTMMVKIHIIMQHTVLKWFINY